jgi:hypothetical protein
MIMRDQPRAKFREYLIVFLGLAESGEDCILGAEKRYFEGFRSLSEGYR